MMVDPCIHGTTDPFPADIGDHICSMEAVSAGGECGAAELTVPVSEIRTIKKIRRVYRVPTQAAVENR